MIDEFEKALEKASIESNGNSHYAPGNELNVFKFGARWSREWCIENTKPIVIKESEFEVNLAATEFIKTQAKDIKLLNEIVHSKSRSLADMSGCKRSLEHGNEKLRTQNQSLREALEKIRSNMFLVCQPNHGHFFGEVDDLITEALAETKEES